MAELADAPDLGSGAARCGGSSPPIRIIKWNTELHAVSGGDTRAGSSPVIRIIKWNTELRKGHRQFLRGYDRIVDGRYLIYEDPSSSYEHSVFFYDLFIHPGDVIIRFIHDQDGEKDRAFL